MNVLLTLIAIQFFTLVNTNAKSDMSFYARPVNDTIYATTEPIEGFKAFQKRLEHTLNGADSVGKKYEVRLNNIAFIVGADGKIDSAWIIFYRKPLFHEVIKQLKSTRCHPAERDGVAVASRQELHIQIYLTKRVLKKYRGWPFFTERILPWVH